MKNKLNIIGIFLALAFLAGYLLVYSRDGVKVVDEIVAPTEPTATPEEIATQLAKKEYSDSKVTFWYPESYKLNGSVESGYLSLMSPLDPDKPPKETTVGENELKIEIVTEESVDSDSSEKCFFDHSEDPKIVGQEDVVVDGVSAIKYQWEGLGSGEFICLIKGDMRYLINKYPIETNLNQDYVEFLSSFKFK